VAECLNFLRNELTQFKKEGDEENLDTEKEINKQRAFTIIGKRPGKAVPESIKQLFIHKFFRHLIIRCYYGRYHYLSEGC
jgi:hypothetical protein